MATPRKYRIRCTTEAAWVFVWADAQPTTCPNNASHDVDTGTIAVDDTYSMQLSSAVLTKKGGIAVTRTGKPVLLRSPV